MRSIHIALLGGVLMLSIAAFATIFGAVEGLIHDPQHRPVQNAQVEIRALNSDWKQTATSTGSGEFHFEAVPLGEYKVTVSVPGFAPEEQNLVLTSGRDARLHFALTIAQSNENVQVTESAASVNPESSTTSAIVSRTQIEDTPGADQTNSMAMITNFTPGAYMVHDQLHIRGGHQVSWLLDGVPVPNTNIASNVGPQFDPKDVDYLEVQRGGYSADYGDRTYGVFNVVTRSGFERNRQGELVARLRQLQQHQRPDQLRRPHRALRLLRQLQRHTAPISASKPPIPEVLHDQAAGLSGFASIIFNKTPNDQFRLVTSLRGDHYQVPNDDDQQAQGIRDVENERDDFANFSWLHTIGAGAVLTVSPFYHYNRAHYTGGYVGAPDPDRHRSRRRPCLQLRQAESSHSQ